MGSSGLDLYFGQISGFQGQVQLVPDDVICGLLPCSYYASFT